MPGTTRSFTKTFTNNSQFKLILDWSYSQNIGNNTSTVTAILKVQSMGHGVASGWVDKSAGISINGNNMGFTVNPNMGANQTKELARRSYTFSHNGDGTKSVNISANVNYTGIRWNGGNLGNVTVGGNATLRTIPRSSSVSGITGATIGSGIAISIARSSTSFTHDVSLRLGSETVSATGVGSSVTLTPDLDAFCRQLPNSTNGVATVTVVTKSGGSTIGTSSKSHTIYIPESVVPTYKTPTVKEIHGSLSKLGLTGGKFVQGRSIIEVTLDASGSRGATIRSWNVNYWGMEQSNSHKATVNLDRHWGNVGLRTITWSATDTRGRSVSGSLNINILPYSPPSITSFKATRNGSSVSINRTVQVSRVDGDKTGYGITVHSRPTGATNWELRHSEGNSNTSNISIGGLDPLKSYDLKMEVSDYFVATSSMIKISTDRVLIDINKNLGVGIGKVHERGSLDVAGELYLNGINLSTQSSGFSVLPNGVILQWGTFAGSGRTTFPIAFPNSCLQLIVDGQTFTTSSPVYKTLSSATNYSQTGFDKVSFGLMDIGALGTGVEDLAYRSISGIKNFAGSSTYLAIGR